VTTILVVDDNETNRKLLVTLLRFEGYLTVEAVDGHDGLVAARREKPGLVISDILMPSMDGYEFVRRIRADASISATPVIFCTAHYHEREARSLAASCQVARVLTKPCETRELLRTVAQVLEGTFAPAPELIAQDFDHEHLRLLTNKLAERAADLGAANARLAALTDLNLQLASVREPRVLLEKVCSGARDLLGARFAVLAVTERGDPNSTLWLTSGIDGGSARMTPPRIDAGMLGRVFSERRAWRLSNSGGECVDAGLPQNFPPARAFLAVPVGSLTQCFGWLCLADKVGAVGFDAEDERILAILGSQVGRIYENGSLYQEVQNHATQLLVEIEERERASEELRASEERFRQLAENIEDAFFLLTGDLTQTLYVSPAYERIWGRIRKPRQADCLVLLDNVLPEDAERVRTSLRLSRRGPNELEYRIVRPDSSIRWIMVRTFPIRGAQADIVRVVGVATDISERKHAEEKIGHLNRVYSVLSGINSLIVRVSAREELFNEACRLAVEHGKFRHAWCGWWDTTANELVPVAGAGDIPEAVTMPRFTLGPDSSQDGLIARALRSRQPAICNDLRIADRPVLQREELVARGYRAVVALPLVIESRLVGCLVLTSDEPNFFDDAEMRLLTELAGDVSFALDHIDKAERLNYLAYYDSLTGLANRTLFQERLGLHVAAAARNDRKLALVIVDPEHFRTINESFGRPAADELLRTLGERLAACVGTRDLLARIGSDQFAAVIPEVREEAEIAHTLEKWWHEALGAPFTVDGGAVTVAAQAGIAVFPNDGEDAGVLLRSAETALKKAKAEGEKFAFYTPHLSERLAERLSLESRMRSALENEEFILHYQPKVDLETRRLLGVEALIRWHNPELGLIPPVKFIPLMEENGMIMDVGLWVLRQAILDRSRWLERRLQAPRVAINVSTVQLQRSDFVRMFARELKVAGSEAGIDIEVTESLLMDNVAGNIDKLSAIRELGVGIALDDFGTGYSSLAYLTRLPVETLKIDRSFVTAMLDDPGAMTLVSTIISLAHALKLETVAEGVESEEQAKILRLLRCDQMQGYLISKPVSFEDMTAYLGRSRS
jgi:diguanylate cyclase (GGDEF)-like protein/PAS domain S-box-containing protein